MYGGQYKVGSENGEAVMHFVFSSIQLGRECSKHSSEQLGFGIVVELL